MKSQIFSFGVSFGIRSLQSKILGQWFKNDYWIEQLKDKSKWTIFFVRLGLCAVPRVLKDRRRKDDRMRTSEACPLGQA